MMMPRSMALSARVWSSRLLGRPRIDAPLLLALLGVAGIGLVVLYSASDGHAVTVMKQALRLGIGFLAFWVASRVPVQMLRAWTPGLFGLSFVLLAAVFAVGSESQGAQRWLDLGIVRFQPSELMKLTLPMMVAWYFHSRPLPPGWLDSLSALALTALPCTLIVIQPDLGTAVLIAASGCFVLFLAGLRWRIMATIAAMLAAAAPLAWLYFLHDYQKRRILTFLSPEEDPLGSGWNIIQSKIAVGSGGLFGKGWLNGTQSHLEFLPERSTDFILAVFAEEFGLVGVVGLLALYLFIIGRGLWIANNARDTFSRLLAGALSLTFSVYVVVNTAMVSGLLPVVGVPLPLVSYGGTSAVTLLAGFGILAAIANDRRLLRA